MKIYIVGMRYDGDDDIMAPADSVQVAKAFVLKHCKGVADKAPKRLEWTEERGGAIDPDRWRAEHEDMEFVIEERELLTKGDV